MDKKKLNDVIWIKDKDNYINSTTENIELTKELLDSTGSGFCLAKFTQVTMHLGTGLTHACHHPSPHKIPIEEISENPAALFNTKHLKKARKEMLDGGKPKECDYCWRVENNGNISDRMYKSLEPWAIYNHDRIQNLNPNDNIYPTYLEVDFSNVCNFMCTYCGPEYSSKWVENLKQHGPVKLLENTKHVQWSHGWQDLDSLSYKNSEFNPYLDAFWKWFPEVYKNLKVYRITGGEPLLSKETYRSLDWFMENPNTEIDFSINSNLCAPEQLWNQFIEKVTKLVNGNCVSKFTIFTSVDGWGKQAEYARPGLDFELFKKRYEQILSIGKIRAVVMCTFNIFSITSIQKLLEWQVNLKRKYNRDSEFETLETQFNVKFDDSFPYIDRKAHSGNHFSLVGIDIPYLRSPEFLDAHFITPELIKKYLIPAMHYMARNVGNRAWGIHQGFEMYEVEKFKRIVYDILYFSTHQPKLNQENIIVNRAKFYDFVNEIDKRHNRNFLEIFPEMQEYYDLCFEAKNKIVRLDIQ